ncbi:MAG: hypothetical protein KIT16_10050 [Rhodospirillaceae bacterium]|nr:hypothetical protein [Rhodospirillaceae bacterium]
MAVSNLFSARNRREFTREIRALAGRSDEAANEAGETAAKLQAANRALERVIAPLFETYAELVQGCGRSCEIKLLPGSTETHPQSAAVADFLVDLQGVPGLSEYYLRLENDGGDWKVLSRPSLLAKGRRRETELVIPPSENLPSAIEGVLQQFIRLIF